MVWRQRVRSRALNSRCGYHSEVVDFDPVPMSRCMTRHEEKVGRRRRRRPLQGFPCDVGHNKKLRGVGKDTRAEINVNLSGPKLDVQSERLGRYLEPLCQAGAQWEIKPMHAMGHYVITVQPEK